jgi:hypothetical protein
MNLGRHRLRLAGVAAIAALALAAAGCGSSGGGGKTSTGGTAIKGGTASVALPPGVTLIENKKNEIKKRKEQLKK